ncbi:hypothetical protein ACIRVK_36475 [Streptomyces sp. NPDC101152]|uniref:hypothetical protein n=1 Tax=Streptomyces sp. NPDC101152 TaxID=3366116 RepID=UPI00381A563C
MCRQSASVCLIKSPSRQHRARSFAAIGQWARNAPQDTLARLGARTTTVFSTRIAPSTVTIRRVLTAVCPGSRTPTSPAAHLLAAMTGDGQTVTQLRVPAADQGQPARIVPALEVAAHRPALRPRNGARPQGDTDDQGATVTDLGLDFPHAVQAAKTLRHRTHLRSG